MCVCVCVCAYLCNFKDNGASTFIILFPHKINTFLCTHRQK